MQPFLAQAVGTGEAGLFVDGDECFERGVLQFGVLEDGQNGGHAYAVVGAQGGAVGGEPLAVEHRLYGIGHEVELLVGVFLAHHVHVGLQAHRGALLVAFGGGLADEHVAQAVGVGLEAVAAAPFGEKSRDALFVLRRTRDLHNLSEPVPHTGRPEVL